MFVHWKIYFCIKINSYALILVFVHCIYGPLYFNTGWKVLSCEVHGIILEKWLEDSKPFEIVKQFNIPGKANDTVDLFVCTESVQQPAVANSMNG